MSTALRAPFNRINNPYIWAFGLDALDVLGWIPFVGEVLDIVQTVLGLMIFQDPFISLIGGGAELVLPGPLDILPIYTVRVYLSEKGVF